MEKANLQVFAALAAVAIALILPLSAPGQNASESLYHSKCAVCHGPDGSGSVTGKKLGAHDFQTPDVQKMSDADLSEIIGKGKDKMPAYGKTLKADEIKGLVAYIRSLKK